MLWGRLLGALFGYKVLGLLGAILGFAVGTWFDRGLRLHVYHFPRSYSVTVQEAFFQAVFLVMGHLAKADGRVNEIEIRAARNIMSRLKLTEDLKTEAIRLFSAGKKPNFNLEQTLLHFFAVCKSYPDVLRFFIEIQLEVALADGALQSAEQRLLLLMCQSLQCSPQEFEPLWTRQEGFGDKNGYQDQKQSTTANNTSLQDAYEVLGIASTATPAEIKKAYRRLMTKHHPDKLAARGLPENMIHWAKEKTQEIRAAYDLIRATKGFR